MPLPMEYQHASESFEKFLSDAKDALGLSTRNQTYTTVEAVLLVFRRRLDVREALRFADTLPPILRAIFVSGWDIDAPKRPFGSRAEMTAEVQALRPHHNFSPDSAIRDVASALRKAVDAPEFERVLATLPEDARDYWRI